MRTVLACMLGAALSTTAFAQSAPPKLPFDTFAEVAPRVGEAAPDFELTALDGTRVRLSEAIKKGPVALVFGSFS